MALTFTRKGPPPVLFEDSAREIRLSVNVDFPDTIGVSLQAGGSARVAFPPEEGNEKPYFETIDAQLNTEYLTIKKQDLPRTGLGCLDGYHLTYEGPADPSSDSPALLYHYEHFGVTKLDLRLVHLGAGRYRCTLDAVNEVGDGLSGTCDLQLVHLSISGENSADDPMFDSLANALMGGVGSRRKVTQQLGGTREKYYLFVDAQT